MKKKDFGLLMSMKRKKSTRKMKLELKKWDSQLGNIREIMEYLKLRKKSNKYNKSGTDKKSTRISMSIKKKYNNNKSKSKNDIKKINKNFLTNLQNSRFLKKNKSIEIFKKKKSKNISLLKKNTSFNNLFILDANFGEFIRKKKKKKKEIKKSESKKKRKNFLGNCDFKISKLNNYLSNSYNKNKVVKKYLSIDPKSKLLKNMTQTSKYVSQKNLKKDKNPIKIKLDILKKDLKSFFDKYKNFENENNLLKREIKRYKVILKKK